MVTILTLAVPAMSIEVQGHIFQQKSNILGSKIASPAEPNLYDD
jgi:hypothetical protein